MKKLFIVAAALFLFSCSDHQAEQKKIMSDIMNTHERVMDAENKLMDNKLLIDSLVKSGNFDPKDSAVKKADLRTQSTELANADEAMDNWMHNFDPHKKGRSDEEQLKYLQDQNKEIDRVDTLIISAVKSSNVFLNQIKK